MNGNGISVGLVTADAADVDLTELQRQADAACYAAKNAGRNRVHVVSPSVQSIVRSIELAEFQGQRL